MWTNDSQRILLDNFDTIYNSPSHLYHSALPLSPSSSWLSECYSSELSLEVRVVMGLPAGWGMCSRTVLLNDSPWTLSYWNNTIAVGSGHRDILILDAITGSQTAVLPGHTDAVRSLTFSSDGISLVSGSHDKTVKLWDVQTGGVVKTFYGHTDKIWSVSISADHTTIASGSEDNTLRLWNIEMGECHHTIEQPTTVDCTSFSPTDPQYLLSVSGTTAQHWDIDGNKVGLKFISYNTAFSPDGTQLISYTGDHGDDVIVQHINSGATVAEFTAANGYFSPCCFSPDGRLVAVATGYNVCVWEITGSNPHLVETFVGHTHNITSIKFSSSSTLISASEDKSVKFWQIGASSTDPVVTDPNSTPLTSTPTKSVILKAKNSIIIPSDLPDGVMKTWGISTGHCKGSLQTLAEDSHQNNTQLIDSKLIFVWYAGNKINIWDAEKGELLQAIDALGSVKGLRVSGDGSKVFYLYEDFVQALDIWTGKAVGNVENQHGQTEILATDGSKVWVEVRSGYSAFIHGWDFGISGSSPVEFSNELPEMLHLNDTKVWETNVSGIKDVVTGKVILQLPERFGKVVHVQWGIQYLVVSFRSKEALILDFSHMLL